jgi:hypothetical protein
MPTTTTTHTRTKTKTANTKSNSAPERITRRVVEPAAPSPLLDLQIQYVEAKLASLQDFDRFIARQEAITAGTVASIPRIIDAYRRAYAPDLDAPDVFELLLSAFIEKLCEEPHLGFCEFLEQFLNDESERPRVDPLARSVIDEHNWLGAVEPELEVAEGPEPEPVIEVTEELPDGMPEDSADVAAELDAEMLETRRVESKQVALGVAAKQVATGKRARL